MTDDLLVPDDLRQRWVAVAMTVRTVARLTDMVREPKPGSEFMHVEIAFAEESITHWAREGLRSSVDHMLVWANHSVPVDWPDDYVVRTDGYRWIYTLARACLEGSAQSLWLTRAGGPAEAVARLVRMIRHDLIEQAKAWRALGRDVAQVVAREESLAGVADQYAEHGTAANRLPSMVDMIRAAGEVIAASPDQYEAAYRVSSAAAHGKGWAAGELTTMRVVKEWRPGQYQTASATDPDQLTKMLETASSLLSAAAGLYLKRCGYDEVEDFVKAAFEVARHSKQKDGGVNLAEYAQERGYDIQ